MSKSAPWPATRPWSSSRRFSTVRTADVIVVIEDGRMVETGSHDELVALDGHCAAMFNTQAQRYR